MIVVITEQAQADLKVVGDFIAEDNPRRSITFVRELVERCERLADMPHAFQLVPGHEHTGIRRRPHGEYLIFYTVGATTIEVLHILNGAQDHEAILFPDEER